MIEITNDIIKAAQGFYDHIKEDENGRDRSWDTAIVVLYKHEVNLSLIMTI